ncbi:methyltransferase domain-containing protein [Halalkalicoccus ordinarius]|uniref:methyltransferase domain-containing protein n=1 Tax=Halalkalicoccus ordinarius TaxID=3116651 RepID=UPI00300F6828
MGTDSNGNREERADRGWSADAYDDDHSFVYEYGEGVVDLLDPAEGERILDIGCGTGHLTEAIAERGADAVGLDASAEMIERARESYPDRRFVRADARSFASEFDEPFDAAFSNAALHWIPEPDHDATLSSVHDALRPGGRFVAELGGAGNVEPFADAIRSACAERGYDVESPWYFPSVGEYAPRLESAGFEVRYATLFDRPTALDDGEAGLRNWIGMFATEFLEPVSETERDEILDEVEGMLRGRYFRDGEWVAPYRRLRFVAVRERR